jgi:hypothetical protein
MATASLHINKLAAAKRQLQAAIRMFFLPEDELAVHTVAAAAYGLLKDIKSARGLSEAADTYLTSIFYLVRDYRRGTLPAHMTGDAAFMAEVEAIAAQLSPITADSKLSDVRASIAPALEKQYWNDSNRAANFLKHADRDNDGTLSLDEFDNQLLLAKCFCAYQDVAPDDLGNEGLVFQAFITTNNPAYQPGNTSFDSLILSMRKVPAERQLELCHRAILELNADE